MVVHSYLYYRLNESIWSDSQFDLAARELAALQAEHGTEHGFMDDVFSDWDGSTGFHLVSAAPPRTYDIALQLLHRHRAGSAATTIDDTVSLRATHGLDGQLALF